MGKQATIRDVAKLANVSLATVSRVLNDVDYPVRAELKQRVKDAVEQLGYVPNAMARSLRGEGNRDIGLVIPNVSNPFYLQAMLGITEALSKQDYSLILCNTARSPDRERDYLHKHVERQTRGIILSSVDDNADVLKECQRKGLEFVLLDQMVPGVESAGIHFDSRAGARMVVEYLVSLGHRKIAFATLTMTRWTRTETHSGYRDALVISGLNYDPTLVYEEMPETVPLYGDVELEAGQCIAERFVADGCPATAIVCINDMLAIGVIKVLRKHGIRVPEDVSVTGFDDVPVASTFEPSLTTVRYPAMEAGQLAALMLLDKLENNSSSIKLTMQLPPDLVIRDTTAVPKSK